MGLFRSIERVTGMLTTLLFVGLFLGYTYVISRATAQFAIDAKGNFVKEKALAFTLGVKATERDFSALDKLRLPGGQCKEDTEI
ncbi:MAG: hypothetical protein F6K11_00895 [Leptolyngbya sp. SIO3F4]|nr:hypothetical protein [Leptolyngbya sp. SIO3F4]